MRQVKSGRLVGDAVNLAVANSLSVKRLDIAIWIWRGRGH